MKMKLLIIPILLLCLCVSSWGSCTSQTITSNGHCSICNSGLANCGGCSPPSSCGDFSTYCSCSSGKFCFCGELNYYCVSNYRWFANKVRIMCDTQAEMDSVACELKPGMKWVNGTCSAPVCEIACSSQKAVCTDWKDSVTYTVDAGTGDTTFSCVGYCRTARMTHTDSVEAMDDSLSIIYRRNFSDSVKVNYGENCTSPADTTGGGNPQEVDMTYFVSFNNVENELDTAGVSFVKGLYNQSCESTLYRGIKNGRYVFWYSPNDIPEGVTNVVRIR